MITHGGRFVTDDAPVEAARVVVFGSFVNSGQMPSVLYDWQLTAEMNGKMYKGEPSTLGQFTITEKDRTITYFADDALYERALTPVPIGGIVQGVLLFVFPKLDQDSFPDGTKFTLTFLDAINRRYTHVVTSGSGTTRLGYLPGLHQELTPVHNP
jgi:hypothetical protein